MATNYSLINKCNSSSVMVDSSLWVALFLDWDTHHDGAKRLIAQIEALLLMPISVMHETVTVLAYKHSKLQADKFIEYVAGNHDIVVMDENINCKIP